MLADKEAKKDFLQVCKLQPTDRGARDKLKEVDNIIKVATLCTVAVVYFAIAQKIAFEQAIAVDHVSPFEEINIDRIGKCENMKRG